LVKLKKLLNLRLKRRFFMEINPCCVCGEEVKGKAHFAEYKDKIYYLCCPDCQKVFESDPEEYALEKKVA